MSQQQDSKQSKSKGSLPHEAVLLSKIITEKQSIKITFLDGEILIDQLRWHTSYHLGLKGGKVVNKSGVKYWEIL